MTNELEQNWKCDECESKIYPTWQSEGHKPDICDECMKLGWSEATVEDVEELNLELRRNQIYKQQKERN